MDNHCFQVDHYCTFTQFGASIAARRLHDALVSMGIDSRFHYRWSEGENLGVGYAAYHHRRLRGLPGRFLNRLVRLYAKLLRPKQLDGYDRFRIARLDEKTMPVSAGLSQVLHLHWIEDMLDYPSFFCALPRDQPIVWTLHDMNPLTGGCHYSWDCGRHAIGCGNCPQLNGFRNSKDISHFNFVWKKLALAGRNVHVVANSSWLESEARRSEVFADARSFRTIHCGLDHEIFTPQCRESARREFDIELHRQVICFGAESINDRRKGIHLLLEALASLKTSGRDFVLLTFGGGSLPATPFDVRHVGRQSCPRALAKVYSAADIFVIPSLHEAFGQTALEALSCGLPVVGFATGGIPDMVEPYRTGLLAKTGSVQNLAEALAWLLDHPCESAAFGRNGRAKVLENFTLGHQATKYLSLYRLLAEGGGYSTLSQEVPDYC